MKKSYNLVNFNFTRKFISTALLLNDDTKTTTKTEIGKALSQEKSGKQTHYTEIDGAHTFLGGGYTSQLEVIQRKFQGKTSRAGQGAKFSQTLPMKVVEEIVDALVKKKKTDTLTIVTLITGLAQKGGANKSAGSAAYQVDDIVLGAAEVQKEINERHKNGTIRQLCRTISDQIAAIAIVIGEDGDLARQMRLEFPHISKEEAAWCSSFQTTNPKCPENVRIWLVENHKKRFSK